MQFQFHRIVGMFIAVAASALMATVATAQITRLMPLGDSITNGSDGGYRTVLFNRLNEHGVTIDFVGSNALGKDRPHLPDSNHEGHGGWRTYNIQHHIVDWMRRYEPDVILLHIGTNDISTGADAPTAAKRLSRLIGTIFDTDPDVRLYVASIILRTDSPEKAHITEEYAALTPGVVRRWRNAGFDARFVPMHEYLGPGDLADHLHPNTLGYDKMGLVWWAYYDGPTADARLAMTTPDVNQPVTLTARRMEPGAEVHFYATTAPLGATEVPGLGVTLDVNHAVFVGSATANGDGVATYVIESLDRSLRYRTIRVQAAMAGRKTQALIKVVR